MFKFLTEKYKESLDNMEERAEANSKFFLELSSFKIEEQRESQNTEL